MTDPDNALPQGDEQDDLAGATDDSAFNDAWAEATGQKPDATDAPTADDSATGEQNEEGKDDRQAVDDQTQTDDQTAEGAAVGDSDANEATSDDDESSSRKAKDQDVVKAEKEELKRWQGRTKKAKEEAEAEEARLAKLREEQATALAQKAVDDEMTDEEKAELAEVLADYPQIAKLIDVKLKKAISTEVPKVVNEHVDPVSKRVQASELEAHTSRIASKHADYVDVVNSDDFSQWLSRGVTYDEGKKFRQVIQQGSANQVIEMLDAFKGSRQPKPKQNATDDSERRRQQLDAAATVRHRSVMPKHNRPVDQNDYDGAWNEATKRSA